MPFLTGPVHTLQDFQVEYNGFLMGAGTPYELPQGTADFLNMAPVKSMDVQRVWSNGSWSGPDFADVMLPQMKVEISGYPLSQFQANVAAFRQAFSPQPVGLPFWVKVPGMPAMGVLAKPNKRDIPQDWGWNGGLITATLQLRVTDPVWQSVPRTITLAASGANQSGLSFPLFTPATYPYPSRTNYCTNPGFEVDTSSWGAGGNAPTLTRDTSMHNGAWSTASMKIAWPNAAYDSTAARYTVSSSTAPSGSVWTASADVYVPAGNPGVRIYMGDFNTGAQSAATTTTGQWVRVNVTFTVGGSSGLFLDFRPGVATTGTEICYVDNVLLEKVSTVGTYFDGSFHDCSWAAAANASVSYLYTPVLDFGGSATTPSSGQVVNTGNAPCWPVVTVPGPSSGFTILLDGNTVTYGGTLQSSDVVTVDYATGQATLNATVDRTTALTSRQFSPVAPASVSTVLFSASTGTAQVTVADMSE